MTTPSIKEGNPLRFIGAIFELVLDSNQDTLVSKGFTVKGRFM